MELELPGHGFAGWHPCVPAVPGRTNTTPGTTPLAFPICQEGLSRLLLGSGAAAAIFSLFS